MKSLFTVALMAFAIAASAQKQKIRIHCLAEVGQGATRLDSLQFQERWFRERASTTTNVGRCMYLMAEWTAAQIDIENAEFDPKTGESSISKYHELSIQQRVNKIVFK